MTSRDPQWAIDAESPNEIILWKERAEAQLRRAQHAEVKYDMVFTELERLRFHEVVAVGATPDVAILALAKSSGWGEVDIDSISDLTGGDPAYGWGRRFAAGGTGFKVAGKYVPGGVTITWWK